MNEHIYVSSTVRLSYSTPHIERIVCVLKNGPKIAMLPSYAVLPRIHTLTHRQPEKRVCFVDNHLVFNQFVWRAVTGVCHIWGI